MIKYVVTIDEKNPEDLGWIVSWKKTRRGQLTEVLDDEYIMNNFKELMSSVYNNGVMNATKELSDAVGRIARYPSEGGMSADELIQIFGCSRDMIFRLCTLKEIAKKIAEYDMVIRVGDEVTIDKVGVTFYVTHIHKGNDFASMMGIRSDSGEPISTAQPCHKTGKHSDEIEKLFGGKK